MVCIYFVEFLGQWFRGHFRGTLGLGVAKQQIAFNQVLLLTSMSSFSARAHGWPWPLSLLNPSLPISGARNTGYYVWPRNSLSGINCFMLDNSIHTMTLIPEFFNQWKFHPRNWFGHWPECCLALILNDFPLCIVQETLKWQRLTGQHRYSNHAKRSGFKYAPATYMQTWTPTHIQISTYSCLRKSKNTEIRHMCGTVWLW